MFWKTLANEERAVSLLRGIDAAVSSGIAAFDEQGRHLYVNDAFCRMVGRTREELQAAKPPFGYWPPERAAELTGLCARLRAGESPVQLETVLLGGDGRRFPALLSVAALQLEGGLPGWVFEVVDLSPIRAQRDSLNEIEWRFRELAETIEEVFYIVDAQAGRILYVSPAFERVWGRPCQDLYDLPQLRIETVLPEDRQRVQDARERQLDGRRACIEYRIVRPDGGQRWVWDKSFVISGDAGRPGRIVGIVTDVTERRHAAELLRHAEKMEALGELSGGLAHEFNNLLGIILSNLGVLEASAQLGGPALAHLHNARDAARRGAGIARALLAVARRQPVRTVAAEIDRYIGELAPLLLQSAGPRARLEFELSAPAAAVRCDPGGLDSALINVIANARDAMPGGGTIRLRTRRVVLERDDPGRPEGLPPGEYLEVAVSDEGMGMSEDVLERAFEPLFTTKPTQGGTGLGLSLVAGFMRRAGGGVRLASAAGQGTTVSLFFPLADSGVEAPAGVEPDGPVPTPVPSTPPSWTPALPMRAMQRASQAGPGLAREGTPPPAPAPLRSEESPAPAAPRILVVEDDPSLRELAELVLAAEGYHVEVAADAAQAVAMLEAGRFGLLFSDVMMPGEMDGVALAKWSRERWPRMPVLLASGFFEGSSDEPLPWSMLPKPYEPVTLVREVQRVLRDSAARSDA